MSDELKQVQVMFEQIRSDVRAVAEGHSVLLNAINAVNNNLEQFKKETENNFRFASDRLEEFKKETSNNFRAVRGDLSQHLRQAVPPAHISV